MTIIYIVHASLGEYSHREGWTVKAFINKSHAQAHVLSADMFARHQCNAQNKANAANEWFDYPESPYDDKYKEKIEYHSDSPTYFISECELIEDLK